MIAPTKEEQHDVGMEDGTDVDDGVPERYRSFGRTCDERKKRIRSTTNEHSA